MTTEPATLVNAHEPGSDSPAQRAWWVVLILAAATPLLVAVALMAFDIAQRLLPATQLQSLRAGNLTFSLGNKTGELLLPVVFFGLVILLVAAFLYRKSPLPRELRWLVATEAIIAGPVLIGLILVGSAPLDPWLSNPLLFVVLLQVPPLAYGITRSILRRRSGSRELELPFLVLSSTVSLVILGVIAGADYLLAPRRLPIPVSTTVSMGIVIVLAALVAVGLAFLAQRRVVAVRRWVGFGFASAGVLALPLILPPVLFTGAVTALVPGMDGPAWAVFVAGFSLIILAEASIRSLNSFSPQAIWTAIPSSAIAVFLVALRANRELPSVHPDNYHFGEIFSPFVLWQVHGDVPYVDSLLPRGILLNVVPGAVNDVLNSGQSTTVQYGAAIIALLVVAVAHVVLRTAVGVPLATAMVALLAVSDNYLEGDLFVMALLVGTIALVIRRANPYWTGAVTVVANAIAILAYPMMGIVSTAATLGVVLAATLGAAISRSGSDLRYAGKVALAAAVVAVGLALSPLMPLLWAAIGYVVSNASSNVEAFGVALEDTLKISFTFVQFVQFAFVLAFAATAWMLLRKRDLFAKPSWTNYAIVGAILVPAAAVVVLNARYMGRLDPTFVSFRPAAGTIVILGVLVPAVLTLVLARPARGAVIASLSIAAVLSSLALPVVGNGLLTSVLGARQAPSEWATEDLNQSVSRVGLGDIGQAQSDLLSNIATVTHDFPHGETVLDVSNNGALFGYFEWANPLENLAVFNIESAEAERVAVDRLDADKPQYALLSPAYTWDRTTLTLRNPQLAGWLMRNYTPVDCGVTIWATLNSSNGEPALGDLDCGATSSDDVQRSVPELWQAAIGAPVDLGLLPAAWGPQAASSLDGTSLAVTSSVEGGIQRLSIDLPVGDRRARDLLTLHVTCDSGVAPEPSAGTELVGLFVAPSTEPLTTFRWGAGTLLVPLDVYPEWSMSLDEEGTLTLDIASGGCGGGWTVQADMAERVF